MPQPPSCPCPRRAARQFRPAPASSVDNLTGSLGFEQPRRRGFITTTVTVLAVLIAAVGALRATPARACDPAPRLGPVFPADGATDVALDTLVFLGDRPNPATLTLVSTGQPIASTEVKFEGPSAARALRPDAPLPPNEEILVGTQRRFRTGAIAHRAPVSWQVVDSRKEVTSAGCGDSCGDRRTWHLQLKASQAQPDTIFLVTLPGHTGGPTTVSWELFVVANDGINPTTLTLSAPPDERAMLTPLSSAGEVVEAAIIASLSDAQGCAMGPGHGVSALPLLLLGLAAAALRLPPRRRRR